MLTETHQKVQAGDEYRRRWFSDKHFDLIVWYKPDKSIHGFQLCYIAGREEKASTWLEDKGVSHDRVDDGEGNILTYKMTPILVPDGAFDKKTLLTLFKKESTEIDPELSTFISQQISKYPVAEPR